MEKQPHPLANIFWANLVRFGQKLAKIKAKFGQKWLDFGFLGVGVLASSFKHFIVIFKIFKYILCIFLSIFCVNQIKTMKYIYSRTDLHLAYIHRRKVE